MAAIVLYEELTSNIRGEVSKIFQSLQIDQKDLDDAIQATETESQRSICGPRGEHFQSFLSSEHKKVIDKVFYDCSLPFTCSLQPEHMKTLLLSCNAVSNE